eukprot:jgi/Picsp_1/5916/NSC_03273-R1_---NA---
MTRKSEAMMEDDLEDDFDEEFFANIDKVVEQYKAQKATSQQPGHSPPRSPNRVGGSAEESLKKVNQIADTVRGVETEIYDERKVLQTGKMYGEPVPGHVPPGVQAPGGLDWGAVGRVSLAAAQASGRVVQATRGEGNGSGVQPKHYGGVPGCGTSAWQDGVPSGQQATIQNLHKELEQYKQEIMFKEQEIEELRRHQERNRNANDGGMTRAEWNVGKDIKEDGETLQNRNSLDVDAPSKSHNGMYAEYESSVPRGFSMMVTRKHGNNHPMKLAEGVSPRSARIEAKKSETPMQTTPTGRQANSLVSEHMIKKQSLVPLISAMDMQDVEPSLSEILKGNARCVDHVQRYLDGQEGKGDGTKQRETIKDNSQINSAEKLRNLRCKDGYRTEDFFLLLMSIFDEETSMLMSSNGIWAQEIDSLRCIEFFNSLFSSLHNLLDSTIAGKLMSCFASHQCSSTFAAKVVGVLELCMRGESTQTANKTVSIIFSMLCVMSSNANDTQTLRLLPILQSSILTTVLVKHHHPNKVKDSIWILNFVKNMMNQNDVFSLVETDASAELGIPPGKLFIDATGQQQQETPSRLGARTPHRKHSILGKRLESAEQKDSCWATRLLVSICVCLLPNEEKMYQEGTWWIQVSRLVLSILACILERNGEACIRSVTDFIEHSCSNIQHDMDNASKNGSPVVTVANRSLPCSLISLADMACGWSQVPKARYLLPLLPEPWPQDFRMEGVKVGEAKINWLKRMRVLQETLTFLRGLLLHPLLGPVALDSLLATTEAQQRALCVLEKSSRLEDIANSESEPLSPLPIALWALAIGTSSQKQSLCPETILARRGGCPCCSVDDIVYLSRSLKGRIILRLSE